MPSFSDSIFLFILALLLFGPKKLPVLARELGKWVGEFRRASNEFKMQMEEELRVSEQEDRRRQIAAMEAAAPASPAIDEPEHPHLPAVGAVNGDTTIESADVKTPFEHDTPEPLPIATSGELSIMPPSTGLPVRHGQHDEALDGLLHSIPETSDTAGHVPAHADGTSESVTHAG